VTILTDDLYEETNRRSAEWGEQQVRGRFAEVYGPEEGDKVLTEILRWMDLNIQSDGRSEDLLPEAAVPKNK
jgi:hypothetical protein